MTSISRRCSVGGSSCSRRGASTATGRAGAIIANDMLTRVFGIDGAVSTVPDDLTPFVLPHGALTVTRSHTNE